MSTQPFCSQSMPFTSAQNYTNTNNPCATNLFPIPLIYPLSLPVCSPVPFGSFQPMNVGWSPSSHGVTEPQGVSFSKLSKAKLSFLDFDEHNPRSWLRRCTKSFDLYQVEDREKMTYMAIHLKDYVDSWFDSYIMDHGGRVSWAQFCFDVCKRFGNTRPVEIVAEFNRLEKTTDVESYKRKFEELRCLVVLINPMFEESYFVYCFVGAIKPDILPLVQNANPKSLMEVYK